MDFAGLTAEPYLYLTTTGRVTGLPREIEIWYVFDRGRFYVLAEHFHAAQWVKNIQRQPRVRVRIAGRTFDALARVLDEAQDAGAWRTAQRLGREKYGWGDGLPVEITLVSPVDQTSAG
ncbi:MAG: nitroreductase family deazaflavin-dependent oxidoreductase [Anaerolineae bacterium]